MNRPLRWADRTVFVTALLLYLGVGVWLALGHEFLLGDALARVSAAQAVLFSRAPHAAAIGFVFTPLTALADLPLVALSPWWPELTVYGLAGVVMSALFMAGAVLQIYRLGTDRNLPMKLCLVLTALFALNPMIVFYGANGMSEAPYLFFTCWAARRLIAWVHDDDVHHLVVAGISLGLGYLTRYDAVAPIAAVSIAVAVVTYRRARPEPRLQRAILDGALVALPGVVAFVVWAATSWLITGQAFAQFSSNYGNVAILEQSGGGATDVAEALRFAGVSTVLLAPTLVVLLVIAGVVRYRRRDLATFSMPVLLFGAILVFQVFSYASGSTFGFLRFYVTAIPLAVILALLIVPEPGYREPNRRGRHAPADDQPARPRSMTAAGLGAAMLITAGLPVTAWGMTQQKYAPQEFALAAVLRPDGADVSEYRALQNRIAASFSTERELAAYLDSLDLPAGSVLVDTVYGFAVVAASRHPEVFVVPSDYDFVEILSDPAAAGVRYLLTVPNTGRGESDALNLRYPTIYDNGAEIATLDLEVPNDGADQPNWRVYRVLNLDPDDLGP